MHGELTVYENLWFSVMLRLPSSVSLEEKEARVEEIIDELGLTKATHTRIGNAVLRGVSGGERRRVSIGMELITKPSLMLLDEPTSGLDSKSTRLLVELLRSLAKKGKTIICTIHQPSSYVIGLFDQIALLSRGNPIFFGSVPKAIKFFASNGHVLPPSTNPADFFIETINKDYKSAEPSSNEDLDLLIDSFHQSGAKKQLSSLIDETIKKADYPNREAWDSQIPPYQTSFLTQLYYLIYRMFLCLLRNPTTFSTRVLTCVALAFVTGTLYLRLPYTQHSLQDRIAVLIFSPTFLMYASLPSMAIFMEDREIFLRERMNAYYSVGPYTLASTLVNTFFVISGSVLFSSIVYFLIGLNPNFTSFLYFLVVMSSCLMVAEGVVVLVSTVVKSAETGMSFCSGFFGILMLTGGFLIRAENIPGWWLWVHYLSFTKYTFEGMMVSEFIGEEYPCIMNNVTIGNSNSTSCDCFIPDLNENCIVEGEEVLADYKYQDVDKWGWVGVLLGMVVVIQCLHYVFLRWWVTNKR
eukprot:TRINITY_DN4581_c0_g2_i6.p1 TRINITY_DN4581_c0_g2~~TRINITY_DN4581_c0_g2_i6.p1  ORF type:complete len:524 (+),score=84.22 TRINITY_DN4581_c0_g2_i6:364-1935(+)